MMSGTFEPLRRAHILQVIKFLTQQPVPFRYLNLNKRMEDLTGWALSAIILSFRAQLNARKMCNPVFYAADVSTALLSQVHEVKSRTQ